jgi:hypothetical protein
LVGFLEKEEVKTNKDGKGKDLDNIFIDKFWRSIKQDYIDIKVPSDGPEHCQRPKEYMDCYKNDSAISVLIIKRRQTDTIRQHKAVTLKHPSFYFTSTHIYKISIKNLSAKNY